MRRIKSDNTALFICDIQERFASIVYRFQSVVKKAILLKDVSSVMEIPTFISEQYPERLGKTVPNISTIGEAVFAKKKFSMLTPELLKAFKESDRQQVILCGIETHVCVLQTALDLLDDGKDVFVVCDAVSSQRPYDRTVALESLREAGARLTTAESLVFEMLGSADHPKFKTISALVKRTAEEQEGNEFGDQTTL